MGLPPSQHTLLQLLPTWENQRASHQPPTSLISTLRRRGRSSWSCWESLGLGRRKGKLQAEYQVREAPGVGGHSSRYLSPRLVSDVLESPLPYLNSLCTLGYQVPFPGHQLTELPASRAGLLHGSQMCSTEPRVSQEVFRVIEGWVIVLRGWG